MRAHLNTGRSTYPLFRETGRVFSLFNCGFPLGSSQPYERTYQLIFCNDNIYFAAGRVLAKLYVM